MTGMPAENVSRLHLETDVLVLGGGPAATWAALTASEAGARVILADKGYCGSSGVTAAATIGHWWVAPGERETAMAAKDADGGGLSEYSWMERVLEETWNSWPRIADRYGYPAPVDSRAAPIVQGPVYMREMRRLILKHKVTILDHSPGLELLMQDGAVCGAAGVQLQAARPWQVRAKSVILATGGGTYKSPCIGGHTNTGDAYLMAAEAGALLSGMEFSNYYGVIPVGCTVDKNGYYLRGRFFDERGREIHKGWSSAGGVMGTQTPRTFIEGRVFARFTEVPPEKRAAFRAGQPNMFVQLDRMGIDPFTQLFEVEPVLEGSVRGTGGIVLVRGDCWTGVPGLWAAGDSASRECLSGAGSGAGSANASWTISSGRWSGAGAAAYALSFRDKPHSGLAKAIGSLGLRPADGKASADTAGLVKSIQDEVFPLEKNGLRRESAMASALQALDELWLEAHDRLGGEDVRSLLRAREAASMLAMGRWQYHAAIRRRESRVIHVRDDFPARDQNFSYRLHVSGIKDIHLAPVAFFTKETSAFMH